MVFLRVFGDFFEQLQKLSFWYVVIGDIRVLGAKKSDCQKMGAAHDFFLRAHFLKKKIMGRAPIMRPLFFFGGGRPFFQKKIMGEVRIYFVDFFCMVTTYGGRQSILGRV